MSTTTYQVIEAKSFEGIVTQIESHPCSLRNNALWFRGHASHSWTLVPKAFRTGMNLRREANLYMHFKQFSRNIIPNAPGNRHYFSWLQIMQHHGLGTRLLDWTQNPLVALYFAVEQPAPGASPCLWILDPGCLNFECNPDKLCAVMAVQEPIERQHPLELILNADILDHSYWVSHPPLERCRFFSAINPPDFNVRVAAQQGTYTIHGKDFALDNVPYANKILTKVNILPSAIADIRKRLSLFGIRKRSLFPDLDNLAQDLLEAPEFA
jgi:hypothetical protein